MLVNGFIGQYDSDDTKVFFTTDILACLGEHFIKVQYKNEISSQPDAELTESMLSIFYSYKNTSKNINKLSLLIKNIKSIIKRQSNLRKKSIIVLDNVNNFTSINIDNHEKGMIRIMTKFNLLSAYREKEYEGRSTVEVNRIHLNQLYSNFTIVRNNFVYPKYGTLSLGSGPLYGLNEVMRELYNDGYDKVRAIVSQIKYEKAETYLASCKSLYLEFDSVHKRKNVSIKYSSQNSYFWKYAISATCAWLYLIIGRSSVFQYCKEIHIPENFKRGIEYYRYNLIIEMYNYSDSKSYFYNLFILCFSFLYTITAADNENNIHKTFYLHIIVPLKKAKEYKIYENHNIYDSTQIRWIIDQIIGDSVIIRKKMELGDVFIIVNH